jgi:predicted alpha/beta hydrolase family esterase
MAAAVLNHAPVVPPVLPIESVTLTLTPKEAQAVYLLVNHSLKGVGVFRWYTEEHDRHSRTVHSAMLAAGFRVAGGVAQ